VPPDVTACIFWLKNRDPEHWRDVQNVTHLLGKYIISDTPMSEEEWARERATALDAEPEPRFGYDREETHQDVARKPQKPKLPMPNLGNSFGITGHALPRSPGSSL
jgi:hypothetical protein